MSSAILPEKQACASCGPLLPESEIQSSLPPLCSSRIEAPRETVAKSLHGNWDEALLHCLKSALESYEFIERQIQECDLCGHRQLTQMETRAPLLEC